MAFGVQALAAWMGFVALFGLALLAWAIYSGQLDDLEQTRYIPFNESEPQEWPGRHGHKGV